MPHSYTIPEGTRVYAIGDIHGYADVLADLHRQIEDDLGDKPVDKPVILYVGDYIDRGSQSKQVLDMLIERELTAPHFQHIFLMGNHEDAMFNEFLMNPTGLRQDWLQWGGAETVESYGIEIDRSVPLHKQILSIAQRLNDVLPTTHREFLKNLKLYHQLGDYLFVHAGIKPGVPLEKQTKQDLTFTREPFLSFTGDHGFYVVHGHTATRDHKVEHLPNRLNIDTGLYRGGPLTCAVLEGADIRFLQVRQE